MRSLSFAFLVTLYFVIDINCDIKSSFLNRTYEPVTLREKIIVQTPLNKTKFNSLVPLLNSFNSSLENATLPELKIDLEDRRLSNEERGKLCLRNVTKCMDEDDFYEETAEKISNFMFSSLPVFDLSIVRGVSPLCQKQSKKYINDLKNFKFWALKMFDANAKISSGILSGNINQLGDFDLCLEAESEDAAIRGQYCLASMQMEAPPSAYLAVIHRLAHSHFHFKSDLKDPGHRVPRFSSINWGLCIPSGCSPKDVELGLKNNVERVIKGTQLQVRYDVSSDMCQSPEPLAIPKSTLIVGFLFACIIFASVFATVYDFFTFDNRNEWIISFSLRKNVQSLITMKQPPNDIKVLHGIRFINAVLLVFAHKSMAVFFVPYTNRTHLSEFIGKPWTVVGRAASLYTDPFIMISGILTTYSVIGRLQKTNKLNVMQEYVSRLMRIVPTYGALIAFCTFILPWLSSGPMWNLVVSHHSDICKQYWWRNLLFIHNYFGFRDMCLTHTHHVGIDTQLFFASPLFIFLLWKWPKRGTIALVAIATISTLMRYYVTYSMRLSNYVHFGTSVQQLFETADNMYILPPHRVTVYIMGILLGYILKNWKSLTLSKAQIRIGNALALFSFFVSLIGPAFMGSIEYVYNPRDAAWYAAFAPILWCCGFGWIILTSHFGYENLLGKLFALKWFSLWTKISYTVYLTQFPVFFYNVGKRRNSDYFEFFASTFNFSEFFWIFILSVILTLFFEMPFQNVRNVMFKPKEEQKIRSPKLAKKIN